MAEVLIEKEVPEVSTEDKLILKTFESEAAKKQLAVRAAMDELLNAQRQLNQFAQTVFEKHSVDPKEYALDLDRSPIKFTKRVSE